jgi:hypothetical protein
MKNHESEKIMKSKDYQRGFWNRKNEIWGCFTEWEARRKREVKSDRRRTISSEAAEPEVSDGFEWDGETVSFPLSISFINFRFDFFEMKQNEKEKVGKRKIKGGEWKKITSICWGLNENFANYQKKCVNY